MLRSSSGSKYSRRIMIAVVAALIPMIAGCEAGSSAPTLHWHQPTDGTFKSVGNISIINAFVLGAPAGSALLAGQNAGLFLAMANTAAAPDRLISVSAPGTAKSVRLPGIQLTRVGPAPALLTGPRPQLVLEDLLHPVTGGSVINLVLTFANAGTIHLSVPVMPRAQYYATFRPAPASAPTPAVTPTPSGSPSP